jgi:hypothetical protein
MLATISVLLTGGSPQTIARVPATSLPNCAALIEQVLRCPALRFTYKLPFGWVDRTDDMRQMIESGPPPAASKTLLAAFERPPGTEGDTINSAVIIAVEDRSVYPQIKTATDYFGPLSEIAERRGLKMDGDPYLFSVGGKQVARADFKAGGEKGSMQQASLVVLEKSYILSFTFLAGSDDEIQNLATNLTFIAGVRKPPVSK